MSEEHTEKKERFFEIIIKNPNQASPSLFFQWRLNDAGMKYLKERKVVNAFLLVSVLKKFEYSGSECVQDHDRQLYPLDRGFGYVSFNKPGKYKIHASVIWTDESQEGWKQNKGEAFRQIHEKYLGKRCDRYMHGLHDVFQYCPEQIKHNTLPYHEQIEINIDDSFFALEPPEWLSWWVNLERETEAKNICQWRKRLILAFTIQPIIVAIFLFTRTTFAISLIFFLILIGFRPSKIGWKAIIQPFGKSISDIVDKDSLSEEENYWWITKVYGEDRSRNEGLAMSPVMILIATLIIFIYKIKYGLTPTTQYFENLQWQIFLQSFLMAIVCCSLITLLCKLFRIFNKHFFSNRPINKKRDVEKEKRQQEKFEKHFSSYYNDRLKPITLKASEDSANLELPESHRTITYRFTELKSKICKPFKR